jgi:uncharacterized delta-60 repeat protein
VRAIHVVLFLAASCGSGHHADNQPDGGSNRPGGDGGGDGGVADGPSVMGGDPGFGDDGLVTVNFGVGLSGLTAIAQQSDGKLIAAGATQEAIIVLRATTSGELDTSFGTGGVAALPFGLPANGIEHNQIAVAVQADDAIIVTGALPGGGFDACVFCGPVARLTSDGTLDTSFGSGGVFLADNLPRGIAVTPAGKVLVGGATGTLLQLTSSGAPDVSFGSAGVVAAPFGISAVTVGSNGAIVVASGVGVARYLSNGVVDSSFGSNGELALANPTSENQVTSVAIAPDGHVYVAGAFGPNPNGVLPPFAILRATAAGALDPTFGAAGIVVDDAGMAGEVEELAEGIALVPGGGVVATGVANFGSGHQTCVELDGSGNLVTVCQPALAEPFGGPVALADGSIVVPGAVIAGTFEAALAKIDAGGSADPTFGSAGVLARSEGGSFDRAQTVAVQPDGSILVSGWSQGAAGQLIRLTATGALDATFGSGGFAGRSLGLFGLEWIYDVAVQPSGSIVLGGQPVQGGFTTVRLDATGALDPTFGSGGAVQLAALGSATLLQSHGQTVAADGSIYVVGESTDAARTVGQYAVVHLTGDGVVDASYGSAGLAATAFAGGGDHVGYHASVGSDGSVIVLGSTGQGVSIVRFGSTGAADTAFAGSGEIDVTAASTVWPLGLARQPDGKIVAVAGRSDSGELDVVRFADDGTLDAGFGSDGIATIELGGGNDYQVLFAPAGVAIDGSGNLLIGTAVAAAEQLTEGAVVVRLLPDGSPDASWGPAGVQAFPLSNGTSCLHALAFQPDGKLLAAGRRWTVDGSSDFAVLRLDYSLH